MADENFRSAVDHQRLPATVNAQTQGSGLNKLLEEFSRRERTNKLIPCTLDEINIELAQETGAIIPPELIQMSELDKLQWMLVLGGDPNNATTLLCGFRTDQRYVPNAYSTMASIAITREPGVMNPVEVSGVTISAVTNEQFGQSNRVWAVQYQTRGKKLASDIFVSVDDKELPTVTSGQYTRAYDGVTAVMNRHARTNEPFFISEFMSSQTGEGTSVYGDKHHSKLVRAHRPRKRSGEVNALEMRDSGALSKMFGFSAKHRNGLDVVSFEPNPNNFGHNGLLTWNINFPSCLKPAV